MSYTDPPPPSGPYDGGQPPYGGAGGQPPYGGGQPPYGGGQPPYGGQPSYGGGGPQPTNKKAVWALVTGILGLLCCSPLGVVAIILGRGAQAENARTGQGGSGMAKAGFILGIIAVALLVLQIILFATGALTFDGGIETS
ncbi:MULTISPECIES: DUF4190 domain-containing protein [unclassified Nocardioides]|uniref:DUF4190 domain-containing protein n=1 Tax=unclassified Nocardioides TaxID=2615069 RepID=UPI002665D51D|nr:DUF4190 domain-containing protein [Nocardioides sp. Arc9.136]WKN50121.1 DUF4190 domain-containing protein [Nocardioides sp. Arc9.136]